MESMSSGVEENYRKNLMIVATMISIYSIAGGGFDSELTIAGAKLKFSNPQYLEYVSIVVLLFLWWRHWLVSVELRDEFNSHVNRQVYTPAFIVELIEERACGKNFERFDIISDRYWNGAPDIKNALFYKVGFLHFTYVLSHVDKEGRVRSYKYEFNFISNPKIFLLVNYAYRKAWLKSVLLNTYFGDAILPSVVSVIALTAYIYNYLSR